MSFILPNDSWFEKYIYNILDLGPYNILYAFLDVLHKLEHLSALYCSKIKILCSIQCLQYFECPFRHSCYFLLPFCCSMLTFLVFFIIFHLSSSLVLCKCVFVVNHVLSHSKLKHNINLNFYYECSDLKTFARSTFYFGMCFLEDLGLVTIILV
jgi:hypothetical protein